MSMNGKVEIKEPQIKITFGIQPNLQKLIAVSMQKEGVNFVSWIRSAIIDRLEKSNRVTHI